MLIYKATNLINNKVYIGQTIRTLNARKAEHKSATNTIFSPFYLALNTYGWDNFSWEVLEYCSSKAELDLREIYYIKYFNSYGSNGYNASLGGDYNAMYLKRHKEISKEKMRTARKDVTGKNNPRYGDHRSYTELHGAEKANLLKRKVSAFHSGREKTDSWKECMSRRFSGDLNPMYGKVGANSKASKKYLVCNPEGITCIVHGLSEFCRLHGLNAKSLYALASGRLKSYKGYKCDYYLEDIELLPDLL